jgi:hypothetical protein
LECLGRSWERGIEALEVCQWSGRRNPKEEEEGVFIPIPPELAVGGFLRPGRVTRLLSGILPGYSCKEGRIVEDGLLVEFSCTPTRTRSV